MRDFDAAGGRSLRGFIWAKSVRQARASTALAGATLLGVGVVGLVVGLVGGDMTSGDVGLLVIFAVAGLGLLAVTRAWNLVGRRRAKGDDAPGR